MRRILVFLLGGLAITAFIARGPAAYAQNETRLLPGAGSRSPIEIESEKLDYFDKEQKLVYSENVFAKQDDSTLKASVLTIFLASAPEKPEASADPATANSDVRRMEAEGPVTITSKDQVGQGDRAVYDKTDNKLFLIGNVSLTQRGNVVRGRSESRLVYDLTTGHAQIVGGITSQVTPAAGNGAKKPPEAKQPEIKPVPKPRN